jgi:hypothetical protein
MNNNTESGKPSLSILGIVFYRYVYEPEIKMNLLRSILGKA